jgi:hypothetical protein
MSIPNAQLTTTQWLSLPIDVRQVLIKTFGIPRSEGSQVMDGKVIVSDGHNHRDLAVITIGRLRAFLKEGTAKPDSEFDFVTLFNTALDKIEATLAPVQPANEPIHVLSPVAINVNGVEYAPVKEKPGLGIVKDPKNLELPKRKGGRPKGSKNKSGRVMAK